MLRSAILDIDGTLIISNEAHARAFIDAATGIDGLHVPSVEEVLRLIGMGGDKLIPRAFGVDHDEGLGKRLDERKGEIFRERYLPTLRPAPGARDLLERLRDDGFSRIVATSASEEDLEGLLEQAGVKDLIDDATSSGDVENSKPDPDVVRAALKQAGARPEQAVMLGDTPYDVQAAGRAGVRIIAVKTGGWDEEELRGAIGVYADAAGVLAAYDSTPFGRAAAERRKD